MAIPYIIYGAVHLWQREKNISRMQTTFSTVVTPVEVRRTVVCEGHFKKI